MSKKLLCCLFLFLLAPQAAQAQSLASEPNAIKANVTDSQNISEIDVEPMGQVTSVSQLSDVSPTDWAFQALQSLVERYGCIVGYPDGTYRGNRSLSRYEFAAGLNACLDQINRLIANSVADAVTRADLQTLQKLQEEFASELAVLRGRIDTLAARTEELESNQFSTTTKLVGESIWAVTDVFGNTVGKKDDQSEAMFVHRTRLNFETSFTGEDLLRTRLEIANFGNTTDSSGTNMTLLSFAGSTDNQVVVPHLTYTRPITSNLSVLIGPLGIGYNDIADPLTPPTLADEGLGIPSKFGEFSPVFQLGGGGAGINWNITENVRFSLGYLSGNPADPTKDNGFFNGQYGALANLAFYGKKGAIGIIYTHTYSPVGKVDVTASNGSLLASRPFGDDIATASDVIGLQGFYQFSRHFQIHAWGAYTHASAETSGLSNLSDGLGGHIQRQVDEGDGADIWYGAIGLTFPDVGGEGNLPGLLVGLPPRVSDSDVRKDKDTSYHIEAFYRMQINDFMWITPGVWAVINPENNSNNDTQWVGVLRTTFNF